MAEHRRRHEPIGDAVNRTLERRSPNRRVGNRCKKRVEPETGVASCSHPWFILVVKLFYTGPVINTEMLVVMLEKHGISATQEFSDPAAPDDGDLNRLAKVFVPEADYDRAYQLFYAERQDEL